MNDMEWISNHRTSHRQSVEQLKDLYVELVLTVDVASEDLDTRRNKELQDCPNSPRRSLLRRSLSRSRHVSGSSGRSLQETAFHVLSATPASDKDRVANRDNATVSALSKARSIESRVVELVRAIGEVVADGDQSGTSIRSDAVFEYFCEKNMVSLLVEIAKAKPSDSRLDSKTIKLHEVAFSPRVKAQLLQTISILISNSQDAPSLYYLLSNNHVNELVMGMLPLRQWTNQALEEMLPLYAELLRSLGVQLAASPGLISFLTRDDPLLHPHGFPLFFAAIEVLTSSYANSDSFVHQKCLKLLLSLMQIPEPSIRILISTATAEHQKLSLHICQRLLDRYHRLAMLTTGPVVDPIRSNAIAGQLVSLQNEIESLNDVLWCGVKSLNVRTCECLLQRLVSVLLRDLFSSQQRHLLAVGSTDNDVIPEREASAQVAVLFLSHLFLRLAYSPFIRMLAVAVLHPLSCTAWSTPLPKVESSIDSYILTKGLNRTVQAAKDESDAASYDDIIPNPFRKELLSCLSGICGEWRFIPVAILLESVLSSEALDLDTLVSLNVVPSFSPACRYPESVFEETLAQFLKSRMVKMSAVSMSALDRAGSLAMTMIPHIANNITNGGKEPALFSRFFHESPLVQSLRQSRSRFCAAALLFKNMSGVSQLFVDLIELVIKSRYLKLGENYSRAGKPVYGCPLETFSCSQQTRNADILVRKFRNVGSNDVEDARFAIRMAIHYRALCSAVEGMIRDCSASSPESGASFALDTMDKADNLLLIIGDLKEKPTVNTDLDLRGRMAFRFFPAVTISEHQRPTDETERSPRGRILPEEIGLRTKSQLVLVLDPSDIFIVKHINRSDVNRGTIVCSVSLRSVIACASDGDCLHVAVRNVEDVGFIIKNGEECCFRRLSVVKLVSLLCRFCAIKATWHCALTVQGRA